MAGSNGYGITKFKLRLDISPPRANPSPNADKSDFGGMFVHADTGEQRSYTVVFDRVARVARGQGGATYDRARILNDLRKSIAETLGWEASKLVFVQTQTAWVEDSLWAALHEWADDHVWVLTSIMNLHYWQEGKGWVPREHATWYSLSDKIAADMSKFDPELKVEWRELPKPGFENDYY